MNAPIASGKAGRIAVVVATRNRRESLLHTLARLHALDERPPIIVVDNGSSDGTAAAVRTAFPGIGVISLAENVGPQARTIGARAVEEPYVAFSDDDSWWKPNALTRAVGLFDRFPALAVVAAHVVVGEAEHHDPTSLAMRASPLQDGDGPGRPVLGFLACGSVVRREAFLEVGGFREASMGFEETLLAVDLVEKGWKVAYIPEVVAHHHPAGDHATGERRRSHARNALWFAWSRRPAPTALARSYALARVALRDPATRGAFADVIREAPRLARERRVVEPRIEAGLRHLGL
jgi:GT2 family glycosyltransferase